MLMMFVSVIALAYAALSKVSGGEPGELGESPSDCLQLEGSRNAGSPILDEQSHVDTSSNPSFFRNSPKFHLRKAQPYVRIHFAGFFKLMAKEIENRDSSAGPKNAPSLRIHARSGLSAW